MAYFRKLGAQLAALQQLLKREDNWLILINADPDAMAGALAFQRLIRHRVHTVTIASINEVTRPDNLSMIRYLRLPVVRWQPVLSRGFQCFAIVDSQPSHSPAFDDVDFSVIIDHHPLPGQPHAAPFQDIRPEYGATSTLMTEYLYNAGIRPGRRLATALQYGIRTDTNTFSRHASEVDLRAYHYLTRFGDPLLLNRIMRSEYLPQWLPYFSRAFETLRPCGRGHYTSLGEVESPDLLVVVADFFLKVHGLRWVAVCGVCAGTVVVVFRGGLGVVDLGRLAAQAFGEVGSAGGHRTMARAEFPVQALDGEALDSFTCRRIQAAASIHRARPGAGGESAAPSGGEQSQEN
ncbi:MAG: DHH family phosphoesterase [Desulfovibrionaceae bacterium]|nr:DHH family phosphoesterase [Desulfovibrionaceae bacterium]